MPSASGVEFQASGAGLAGRTKDRLSSHFTLALRLGFISSILILIGFRLASLGLVL